MRFVRSMFVVSLLAACGGGSSSQPTPTTPPSAAAPAVNAPPVATAPPAEVKPPAGPTPEEVAKMEADKRMQAALAEVDAQVEAGKNLFGDKCAGCHGDNGEGTKKGPPVVGKAALPLDPAKGAKKRKGVQFKTAGDVFAWVKKNMPLKKPGSLTDDEYAAVLAFDLKANGVVLKEKLDAGNAVAVVLHP